MGEVGDCLPPFGLSPSIQCVADCLPFSQPLDFIVGCSLLIKIFLSVGKRFLQTKKK